MNQDNYMDPDRVLIIARGFGTFGTVLKAVNTVLETQMMIMRATAFIGLVGGAAVERYLAVIQPEIERLAQKCEEISQDVENSVKKWKDAMNRS